TCMRAARSVSWSSASSRWRRLMACPRRSCSRRLPSKVVFPQSISSRRSVMFAVLLQPTQVFDVVEVAGASGDLLHADQGRDGNESHGHIGQKFPLHGSGVFLSEIERFVYEYVHRCFWMGVAVEVQHLHAFF